MTRKTYVGDSFYCGINTFNREERRKKKEIFLQPSCWDREAIEQRRDISLFVVRFLYDLTWSCYDSTAIHSNCKFCIRSGSLDRNFDIYDLHLDEWSLSYSLYLSPVWYEREFWVCQTDPFSTYHRWQRTRRTKQLHIAWACWRYTSSCLYFCCKMIFSKIGYAYHFVFHTELTFPLCLVLLLSNLCSKVKPCFGH